MQRTLAPRQIYDVYADERIPEAEKDSLIERLTHYYLSRRDIALVPALRLVKLAVSLGGTESLAEHPFSMTHAEVSPEAKRAAGITESMIRLSVGIEHPDDMMADLSQALEQA